MAVSNFVDYFYEFMLLVGFGWMASNCHSFTLVVSVVVGLYPHRQLSFSLHPTCPTTAQTQTARPRYCVPSLIDGNPRRVSKSKLHGWIQKSTDGSWEWEEDDPNYVGAADITTPIMPTTTTTADIEPSATPQLPSGLYRPKQSLGQNYLKDPNTVAKILRAFHRDAITSTLRKEEYDKDDSKEDGLWLDRQIVELGPGAGALTDKLVERYGSDQLQCIEIDDRSVDILKNKHPYLRVLHADVLQVDYPKLAQEIQHDGAIYSNNHGSENDAENPSHDYRQPQHPLIVIGNLPYYITSQILFALADASHVGAIQCATVTMQWEVGQRLVASIGTKDYGILSVVFQLYTSLVQCHFKIPPTVFYPKPKVDSALLGLHFLEPWELQQRLAGVEPTHLRRVVTTAFQQRRKTLRNSLRKLAKEGPAVSIVSNDDDNDDKKKKNNNNNNKGKLDKLATTTTTTTAKTRTTSWDAALTPIPLPPSVRQRIEEGDPICSQQELPHDWASKRPEELTPGQFVELTRLLYGPTTNERQPSYPLKVWRKLKHGSVQE